MASASPKYETWSVGELSCVAVCIGTGKEEWKDVDDILIDCFETDSQKAAIKTEKKSNKMHVQFPVEIYSHTDSKTILRESFKFFMSNHVKSENKRIILPVKDFRTWSKMKFCETIISEFLQYVRKKQTIHEITFCAKESMDYDDAVKACKNVLGAESIEKSPSETGRFVKRKSCVAVDVVKGNLDETEADALACTVSASLDLMQGAVSKALSDKAGKKLQKDLEKNRKNNTACGEIEVVSGYELPCKYVLFGVMWPYDEEFGKDKTKYYQKVSKLCQLPNNTSKNLTKEEMNMLGVQICSDSISTLMNAKLLQTHRVRVNVHITKVFLVRTLPECFIYSRLQYHEMTGYIN